MFKKPASPYIIVDLVYIEWEFFNKFLKCVVLKFAFFFWSSEMTCINSMGSVFTLLILKEVWADAEWDGLDSESKIDL